MKEQSRQPYLEPLVEVIEMESENVLALSSSANDLPGFTDSGSMYNSSNALRTPYNTAPTGELEDLINNILTIEQ